MESIVSVVSQLWSFQCRPPQNTTMSRNDSLIPRRSIVSVVNQRWTFQCHPPLQKTHCPEMTPRDFYHPLQNAHCPEITPRIRSQGLFQWSINRGLSLQCQPTPCKKKPARRPDRNDSSESGRAGRLAVKTRARLDRHVREGLTQTCVRATEPPRTTTAVLSLLAAAGRVQADDSRSVPTDLRPRPPWTARAGLISIEITS